MSLAINLMNAQPDESHFRIYKTSTGEALTIKLMAKELLQANVILFGEEHNDSVTHFLQLRLFEELLQLQNNKVVLSMEMFERDVQTVMDEYLMDKIKEKHFRKDARAWSNYSNYRPLVELAKSRKIPVIAANAASRYSNLAGREGIEGLKALPKASKAHFAPLPFDGPSPAYLDKLNAMMGHGAPAAMVGFDLPLAQSLWDATMAYSIAEARRKHKSHKVLHLNGRFHSDERLGIFTHLKKYAPKAKVLVISAFADDNFPDFKAELHQAMGDFVILTDPNFPKTY
ncbi:MAG: ChaN family lipoprotein [Flavobacteriales bacterium]